MTPVNVGSAAERRMIPKKLREPYYWSSFKTIHWGLLASWTIIKGRLPIIVSATMHSRWSD